MWKRWWCFGLAHEGPYRSIVSVWCASWRRCRGNKGKPSCARSRWYWRQISTRCRKQCNSRSIASDTVVSKKNCSRGSNMASSKAGPRNVSVNFFSTNRCRRNAALHPGRAVFQSWSAANACKVSNPTSHLCFNRSSNDMTSHDAIPLFKYTCMKSFNAFDGGSTLLAKVSPNNVWGDGSSPKTLQRRSQSFLLSVDFSFNRAS